MLVATGTSGSSGASSGSTGVVANPACNDVDQIGPHLSIFTTQASPPTPAGGTIADGTWATTSLLAYDPSKPGGSPYNDWPGDTYVLHANAYDKVAGNPDEYPSRESGTFTTSGTEITFTPTCAALGPTTSSPSSRLPVPAPRTIKYTATATKLTLFGPNDNAEVVQDLGKM